MLDLLHQYGYKLHKNLDTFGDFHVYKTWICAYRSYSGDHTITEEIFNRIYFVHKCPIKNSNGNIISTNEFGDPDISSQIRFFSYLTVYNDAPEHKPLHALLVLLKHIDVIDKPYIIDYAGIYRDNFPSLLHFIVATCSKNKYDICKCLIEHGIDPNTYCEKTGATPLYLAALEYHRLCSQPYLTATEDSRKLVKLLIPITKNLNDIATKRNPSMFRGPYSILDCIQGDKKLVELYVLYQTQLQFTHFDPTSCF